MNCLLLIAATLLWDASEFATGYEVFQRSGTNWVVIGQTNGLSFPVTSRVAYGVIATNLNGRSEMSILPATPQGLRLTNTVQGAANVTGPWTNIGQLVLELPSDAQHFYRAQLDIAHQ